MRIAIRIVAFAMVAAIAHSALAQSQITCHWGKPSAPVRMDFFLTTNVLRAVRSIWRL